MRNFKVNMDMMVGVFHNMTPTERYEYLNWLQFFSINGADDIQKQQCKELKKRLVKLQLEIKRPV